MNKYFTLNHVEQNAKYQQWIQVWTHQTNARWVHTRGPFLSTTYIWIYIVGNCEMRMVHYLISIKNRTLMQKDFEVQIYLQRIHQRHYRYVGYHLLKIPKFNNVLKLERYIAQTQQCRPDIINVINWPNDFKRGKKNSFLPLFAE